MDSPCIGICTLNEDDVCTGCHRTLDEISDWRDLPMEEKRRILDRISLEEARVWHNLSSPPRLTSKVKVSHST